MGATSTILTPLVRRGQGANTRPTAPEADALTTELLGPVPTANHLTYSMLVDAILWYCEHRLGIAFLSIGSMR